MLQQVKLALSILIFEMCLAHYKMQNENRELYNAARRMTLRYLTILKKDVRFQFDRNFDLT